MLKLSVVARSVRGVNLRERVAFGWDRSGTAGVLTRLKTARTYQDADQYVCKALKTAKPYKDPRWNSRPILILTDGLVSGFGGHSGITIR